MSERTANALRKAMAKGQTMALITGKVSAVNGVKSCDVLPSDGGAELFEVRLKSTLDDSEDGVYTVPMKNSECVVGLLNNDPNRGILIAANAIERYVIVLDGGASVELGPQGAVTINGNDYGGLIKWDDLKADLDKLKTFMQVLIQAISSSPTAANDGGAAFKAGLTAATATLQVPQFLNITSEKTKHGSAS